MLLFKQDNDIFSNTPETAGRVYLSVEITAENTGSETIELESTPTLELDGSQYESTVARPNGDKDYTPGEEIEPGETTKGEIVYPIEYSEDRATLRADFEGFDDGATAEWQIDVGELTRTTHDKTGLRLGEEARLGLRTREYRLTATDIEERESYEYTSDDYTYTEEPSAGHKFVLVRVSVENTGEDTVSVPSVYDMNLRTEDSKESAGVYRSNDDAYSDGDISPGSVREGFVEFEVSESESPSEFQVEFTEDITATWNL